MDLTHPDSVNLSGSALGPRGSWMSHEPVSVNVPSSHRGGIWISALASLVLAYNHDQQTLSLVALVMLLARGRSKVRKRAGVGIAVGNELAHGPRRRGTDDGTSHRVGHVYIRLVRDPRCWFPVP